MKIVVGKPVEEKEEELHVWLEVDRDGDIQVRSQIKGDTMFRVEVIIYPRTGKIHGLPTGNLRLVEAGVI